MAKKNFKKPLVILLIIMMVVTQIAPVFADTTPAITEEEQPAPEAEEVVVNDDQIDEDTAMETEEQEENAPPEEEVVEEEKEESPSVPREEIQEETVSEEAAPEKTLEVEEEEATSSPEESKEEVANEATDYEQVKEDANESSEEQIATNEEQQAEFSEKGNNEEELKEEHSEEGIPEESQEENKEESEEIASEAETKEGAEVKEVNLEDEEAAKEIEEEKSKAEAEAEAEIKALEAELLKTLDGQDFSSKRLIVKASESAVKGEPVVGSYEGTYLIQYETERDAKLGYLRMKGNVSLIEVDIENSYTVSDDSEVTLPDYEEPEDTPLKDEVKESNPIAEIETASNESRGRYDVAVIDTGANTVDAVSVLGDSGSDSNGHGQSMVDTIKEIAPNAKVLSIKAIGGNGKGDTSAVYAAIELAIEKNVKVINLSITGRRTSDSEIVENAINKAIANGIVVIGAAGNNATDASYFVPGCIGGAIIAGATNEKGEKQLRSNYGNNVDFFVPAESTSYAAAKVSGYFLLNGTFDGLNDYFVVEEKQEEERDGLTPEERAERVAAVTSPKEGFEIAATTKPDSVTWVDEKVVSYGDLGEDPDKVCRQVTVRTSDGDIRRMVCVETNVAGMYLNEIWEYTDTGTVTNTMLRKALFYGHLVGEQLYKETTYGRYPNGLVRDVAMEVQGINYGDPRTPRNDLKAYLITHHAASKIFLESGMRHSDGATWTWNINSELEDAVYDFIDAIEDLPAPPANFNVYIAYPPSGQWSQAYVLVAFDKKAQVYVKKVSSEDSTPVQGAKFGLWSDRSLSDASKVGATLTTDANGETECWTADPGTYYIKEIEAPPGYKLNETVYPVTLSEDDHHINNPLKVEIKNEPIKNGYLKVKKVSTNPSMTNGNACYSFEGAEFGIYDTEANARTGGTQGRLQVLTTNASGVTPVSQALEVGDYYVRELKAPRGYALDPTPKKVTVTEGEEASAVELTFSETPLADPIGILLQKVPAVGTSETNPPLINAEFTVKYYDSIFTEVASEPPTPERIWVFATDGDGQISYDPDYRISGSDLYSITLGGITLFSLPMGTLVIQETKAPAGYTINPHKFIMNIEQENGRGKITSRDEMGKVIVINDNLPIDQKANLSTKIKEAPKYSGVKFSKVDRELGTGKPQGDAVLSGGEITIYNNTGRGITLADETVVADGAAIPANKGGVLTTDVNGNCQSATNLLPVGKYYAKETKAPTGYKINTSWRVDFNITDTTPGNEKILDKTEAASQLPEDVIRGGVKVGKIDRESGENEPQGQATFKDAEITVYNNSANPVKVNGKEYSKDAAVITLKLNEDGPASTAKDALPYGSYYAKETKPPVGYLPNTTWRVDFEVRENGVIVDKTADSVPDTIIRADLTLSKIDIDGAKMPFIPFLVQRLDKDGKVVESHVILSDANGKLSTKDTANRPKTVANVNTLDQYLENGTYTGPLDENAAKANIWFGTLNADTVKNNRGSLIYSTYKVTELKCANNEGQDMLTQDLFKTEDIKEVFTDGKLFEVENIFVDLIIHPESNVIDDTSETKVVSIKKDASITDEVRWDHLKIGQKYELETVITYESREGETKELGRNSVEFTPSKVDITNTSYGKEYNSVTVDTSNLNGGKLHAVDNIYALRDGERILIASHNKDLNTESQILGVPYMETHASDTRTFDRVGTIHKQAGIIDKIVYENLPNDRMFVIRETIVDKDSPETVIGTAEKVIRVSKRVEEPKEGVGGVLVVPTSGEITMPEITFDASNFNGKTLVVFETLYDYDTDEPYLTHEELSDEEQSIHYIDPVTEALDSKTGTQTGTVGEKEKIIDLVTVSNAIPGMEYKITGNLVYLEDCVTSDGVSHKKGEVIAEQKEPVTVVAESDVFTVEVEFEVDSRMLEGTSGVVFEDVWHKDVLVGFHHDYNAKPQTPNWPKVRTTALGQSTGTHTLELGDDVDIVDTVELTNLTEGDTYKVIGTLMNSDGTPYMVKKTLEDGTEVEEPLTKESDPFTADAKDMTKDITFTINTIGLEGKSLVVYEKLIHIGEKDVLDEEGNPTGETEPNETEVARHEDPTDEGQTVNILWGRTTATDSKTGDHVGTVGEKEIINDKVSLKKLRIGETYTIKGDLHYQEDFKDKDGVQHLKGDVVKDENGEVISANKTFTATAKEMDVTLTFEVNSELLRGARIVVFEKGYQKDALVFSHADVDDPDQRVDEPDIRTTLISGLTGDHVGDTENETVMVDTVELKNLVLGLEYTVRGVLMDKKTGEPVPNVKTEPVTFTAKESDTTVDITFRLSGKDRENRTTVAFEELIHNNVVVVSHKDLDDGNQTVWTPSVITEAKDEETGTNVGRAREETVIVDKITLKNLIKGREYIVTGYLMDQSTGEKYIDADGKEVMGEPITFKATKSTEVKEMTFKFNGSNLKGKTVTVFEDLYHNDVIVAAHRDINSVPQSVDYPDGYTEAKDAVTNTHMVRAEEKATVIDTMYYSNLRPGLKYVAKGTLMNKRTGKPVIENGKPVTGKTEFTPKTKDGEVKIEFNFNASLLKGEELVVFEDVLYNDIEVIVHHDIEDEKQTVVVPEIGTKAIDKADGDNIIYNVGKNTIVDTISYKGLKPGTYWTTLTVMDKATGKPLEIDGTPVTKTEKVTITEPEGTFDVEIEIFADRTKGKTLVMFEEVRIGGNIVAEHKDINDEDQTIYAPEIGTKLTSDGKKEVNPSKETTFIDTVSYSNLTAGKTYIMSGELVNKSTGEVVSKAEVKFVASETGSGTVEITFKADTSKLAGKSVVAFETCTYEENGTVYKVAEHKDINDKDQTVRIKNPAPHTGDENNIALYITLFMAAVISALVVAKRKENK